jgi:uncharacterized LabA/DUF88 family protein
MNKVINKKENNIAFIDGQNLQMGLDWNFHYKSFRQYLKDKYNIVDAYYFLGYKNDEKDLYENLQKAGFILIFNLKGENLVSDKKGNIDVILTFTAMKKLLEENQEFDKIILVSGDGDYKVLVDYLVQKNKFKKLLVPNMKFASSLYKKDLKLRDGFLVKVDDFRDNIEYKQKRPPKH